MDNRNTKKSEEKWRKCRKGKKEKDIRKKKQILVGFFTAITNKLIFLSPPLLKFDTYFPSLHIQPCLISWIKN